jgi:hypothetical protein
MLHRLAKSLPANIVVAGVLSVGAAVACAATAAADPDAPPPPADPGALPGTFPGQAPPPGLPEILSNPIASVLGQSAQTGPGALDDFGLSQYPMPSVPGTQPAPGFDWNAATSSFAQLLPQNFKLAAPDEGNMYTVGQGNVTDQPRLIPSLQGAHAIWHAGMGKLTLDQLGQPLPGTAPPPGTNLPPGPVDFLPDGYGPPPLPPGAPPVPWTPPPPPPAG